jgi:hypothetical protein
MLPPKPASTSNRFVIDDDQLTWFTRIVERLTPIASPAGDP